MKVSAGETCRVWRPGTEGEQAHREALRRPNLSKAIDTPGAARYVLQVAVASARGKPRLVVG